MGHSESSSKGEIYSHKYSKQERSPINSLTLQLKDLGKEEQTKPRASRRKEIINIRAEINEIKNKKTIERNQ